MDGFLAKFFEVVCSGGEVEERCEVSRSGGEKEERWDAELTGDFEGVSAEPVEDEGTSGGEGAEVIEEEGV